MKKYLIYIFSAITVVSQAQVVSSCIAPPELTAEYQKDIVQLATNYLFQIHSPDTLLVHPPQQTLDEVSGGLAAILNAASIPERDSVFNLYCVHNLNGWPYDYAGFLVNVDTSFAWTHAWQSHVTFSGNPYMDSLTTQYALHVDNFYNWSFGNYAELGVDSAWNIMALMDSISYCPGVLSVEQNGLIGGAGKIEYFKSGNDRYYDFYFEFNDCFDGCDNYRKWSFMVDLNCTVYYLGFTDWGVFGIAPLPPPVNCNLFTAVNEISENEIVIFPNPVINQLAVSNRQFAKGTVSIYDLGGAMEINTPFQTINKEQLIEIDVRSLSPGIYIMEVADGQKIIRRKFVKQ